MQPRTLQRPLVVCLHASASTSRQWQPLADRIGRAFDVVAPDLHGHGTGPAWLGEPRAILKADAVRVARLLSSDRRAHLVGHSYGGALALEVALGWPERVKSVTVYEPVLFALLREYAPRARETQEIGAFGRAIARDVRSGFAAQAAQRFVDYWFGEPAFASLGASRAEAVVHRMPAVAAHFPALWDDSPRLSELARSTVPLTLVTGARTRAPARRIAELVRYARRDAAGGTMTAMGHMGPLTHAATVAQRIDAAIAAHERSAPGERGRLAA